MARADLIINLVKAGVRGEFAQFRKTVEALASDERAKNHAVLADRLIAQLQDNGKPGKVAPSTMRGFPNHLVAEMTPGRRIEDLILLKETEQVVRELVEEQHRADLLRSYNLEPRHRVLLAGPPGNGKTSLAEAIADALNVPMLVVRYEAVIGSYLGETAQRITQVFEHARSRQCVLFFDEFDVVGKERGDIHETGEIKRVVSSLLLQIDALPSYVVVVTASNHPELLDRAVWRRFQVRLELPAPKQGQVEEWFRRFEKRTGRALGHTPRSLAQSLKGLSFAEIEDFGTDVLRRVVLSQPEADIKKITGQCLEQWKKRFTLANMELSEEDTRSCRNDLC
jgi:SpoVK/Ycf46/Vps4 family AAA+-type ATPase